MIPITMSPIGFALQFLAEPDIEPGHKEEHRHNTDI
jgi:hypothetical protein